MKKKFIAWGLMIVAVFMTIPAFAALDPIYEGFDETFDYSVYGEDEPFASVHSWVTSDDNETFTYHYQILNVSADYSIHYFQFGIPEIPAVEVSPFQTTAGGNIFGAQYVLQETGVAYGIDVFYADSISEGDMSYDLYFNSQLTPATGSGLLSGFGPDGNVSLYGDVFVPVPEPATISLLIAGAGIVYRKKCVWSGTLN